MQAFWQDYQPYGLWKPKVVFTIHNLNYGQKKITEAATFSQRFTTVSPTYAYETGKDCAVTEPPAPCVAQAQGLGMRGGQMLHTPAHDP
jgi:starch synthase